MSPARPADPLAEYRTRRDFSRTPEPQARTGRKRKRGLSFLVQKHDATRLHYDLRLEWDGVLKSWAVTRGPSDDPDDKRLAVRTEDHPLAYGDFEGVIPKDEYGGGTVMLWDRGTWEPVDDPEEGLAEGKLHFIVHGERMKGEWILIRMKPRPREKRENWLLMKSRDEDAREGGKPLTDRHAKSIASGRPMQAIARSGRTWHSAKPTSKPARGRGRADGKSPAFRKPQLATLVSEAPEGDDWLHEVKFDGYRCLVAVGGGRVRCYTRSGLDWTEKFASVAEACTGLDCGSALIDGEVVAPAEAGSSQFSALQQALKSGGDLRFYAFDLIEIDGEDLRRTPLIERKARLQKLVETLEGSATVQYSEHVRGSGPKVFTSVCRAGQEGIVSKKVDAPYLSRRSRAWLKVKCGRRQEFVIGGWTPSDKKARRFASLLLGTWEDGSLRYRGRVGTGFDSQAMEDLARRMKVRSRKTAPFAEVPRAIARSARWVRPDLVAEISFAELTADGHVRHGSFQGLREDKEAEAVTIETPKTATADAGGATVAGVRISNPDRVLYPQQGVTKIALARYYEAAAERMLPHVADRLMSLVRCPQGREGSCFYQKHAGEGFPDAILRKEIEEGSGKRNSYLYVRDVEGLVSAVQMGTLEFHIWWSRIDNLEKPDRLVFDLDPDEGLDFSDVKRAAVDMREQLKRLGLNSLAMVTGGKGVHVVVPIARRSPGTDAKHFAEAIARGMAGEEPDRFTATMSKAKRKGRIFIDWLRNERGSTAIAPYSTRARQGAPVAMPVTWNELKNLEAANLFHIEDAARRLDDPDPWAEAGGWRQSITKPMLSAVGL